MPETRPEFNWPHFCATSNKINKFNRLDKSLPIKLSIEDNDNGIEYLL